MKHSKYLLAAILLLISCAKNERDYFKEITTLSDGEYVGYSIDIMKNPMGMPPPEAKGTLYLNGKNLVKKWQHYKPLVAESGVVFGYESPVTIEELGKIVSQKIIWSSDNKRLTLVGDWLEKSGGTGTFNLFPITSGENAGKIGASLFTKYWEVWGYKNVDKKTFDKIVKLFDEYYKDTKLKRSSEEEDSENWKQYKDENDLINSDHKNTIIYFYADWLPLPYKEQMDNVFNDSDVKELTDKFNTYKVNAEYSQEPEIKELFKRYNVTGISTILIINEKGDEIKSIIGVIVVKDFINELNNIIN